MVEINTTLIIITLITSSFGLLSNLFQSFKDGHFESKCGCLTIEHEINKCACHCHINK